MILTRLGNKRKMKNDLAKYFPSHRMRIELFFGAGGSFFYLPITKFSILNDFDDDVTNLYLVLLDQKDELKRQIEILPISESLIKYWRKNRETEPMKKALRFLLLSNFTYLGKGDTIRLGIDNSKKNLIERLDPTFRMLKNSKILNVDFRDVLKKISFHKDVTPKEDCFIYLDPIYFGTEHWYRVPEWTLKDTEDCFILMKNCGIKCAMSEFDSVEILELAIKYEMNVIYLKDRQNVKNKRQEILITNYEKSQTELIYHDTRI